MRTALITGASGGIGLEFARIFAREGWDLVLVARGAAKLEEVAAGLRGSTGRSARVIVCDLAVDGAADDVYDQLHSQGVRIDALVNNAGFSTYGRFDQTPVVPDLEEIHVNIIALTHLTKLFVRSMLAAGDGYILNVASTAGFSPGPFMAVYYASKSYVILFSEALADELRGSGVSVTALCPGATKTGFQTRGNIPATMLFRSGGTADAARVARAGYDAMIARKALVIPGAMNAFMAFGSRFVPRSMLTAIARRFNT
jgi:short-subunit dehydrogenase